MQKELKQLIQGNEQVGYFRSIGKHEEAIKLADLMLSLVKQLGLSGKEEHGTTLVNAATAYRAAGYCEKAIPMYRAAEMIYQGQGVRDERLASLFNNMSMAFQEMEDYPTAIRSLENALLIMSQFPEKKAEIATTHANLASVYYQSKQYEKGIMEAQEAVVLFQACEEKDAHMSGALALLAQGYYYQDDLEQSIKYYTDALREILACYGKNDTYALTCENCAIVLEKAGYEKEAQHLRQEAKEAYEKLQGKKEHTGGLDLAKKYYNAYGKQMLAEQFPEYADRAAVGLAGCGSECLGFDDEVSEDHDFGPGFCIWLNDEDYDAIGEKMQEAYEKLPKEFMGYDARNTSHRGTGRVGVIRTKDFYRSFVGDGSWSEMQDEQLAMAVNGEVFADPLGEFTAMREQLKDGMPFAVRVNRLANAVALAAQAGQYNYKRCLERKDFVAAELALTEFMREGMRVVYLLNKAYMPYYKWAWKGLGQLAILSELQDSFAELLETKLDERPAKIEAICEKLLGELKRQNYTYGEETFLEQHVDRILQAKEGMNPIVEEIIQAEWAMFQNTKNTGGRASCQDDFETFDVMRKSQFLAWDLPVLESYWMDLLEARQQGRNLVMEKYAYMMESSSPEEYAQLAGNLPEISEEKLAMINQICEIQVGWREEFANKYPNLSGKARSIHSSEDSLMNTSFETYLRGELKTYSMDTLVRYGRQIVRLVKEGRNLTEEIMGHTTSLYGYASMEAAEQKKVTL